MNNGLQVKSGWHKPNEQYLVSETLVSQDIN